MKNPKHPIDELSLPQITVYHKLTVDYGWYKQTDSEMNDSIEDDLIDLFVNTLRKEDSDKAVEALKVLKEYIELSSHLLERQAIQLFKEYKIYP